MKVFLFLLATLLLICSGYSAKILVVFPMAARSHYNLGSGLTKGLAEAGHDVTLISPFSQGKIPTYSSNGTYREIVIKSVLEFMENMLKNTNFFDRVDANVLFMLPFLRQMTNKISELILQDSQVQELLNSEQTFDAVIVEELLNPVQKLFASHFKAPLIVFSTIGANSWVNNLVGNPSPPSYVPDSFLHYSTNMTFFERLHNSFMVVVHKLFFQLYILPKNKEMARRYFPSAPDLEELVYNPAIVLLNSHISTNVAVPKVPNMIDIGGFHVTPSKELPKDLKKFMDEAPHGVVYFSMGSNLKSADMALEKRNAILNSFSKLKERVLWKFEDENLELPPNVMISKWLPQSDLLAHKNLKLFITHGGLLSTTETVYHGVPILAIPVFGDQKLNAKNAVNNGIGLSLSYHELTEENLTNKLNELLNNPKYRENARYRSQIFQDRIVPPMKEAVYWVEYVIRNPNTAHLRVAGVDLPWFKYLLLDVMAFVGCAGLVSSYIFMLIVKKIVSKCRGRETKIKQH